MEDKIFKAPKGFEVGETEWMVLVEEWKQTGKMVKPMRIKALFPEQFIKKAVE
jgi:hypothetical protein